MNDAGAAPQRLGFLKSMGKVPDDFDSMNATQIADLFSKIDEPGDKPIVSQERTNLDEEFSK